MAVQDPCGTEDPCGMPDPCEKENVNLKEMPSREIDSVEENAPSETHGSCDEYDNDVNEEYAETWKNQQVIELVQVKCTVQF